MFCSMKKSMERRNPSPMALITDPMDRDCTGASTNKLSEALQLNLDTAKRKEKMLEGTFLSSHQGFTHTMSYWEASRKAGVMLWPVEPGGCGRWVHLAGLVYFFPPSTQDLAAILMGQITASPSEASQIFEQNKRGKLVFHRCKVFLDEENLFLTSTITLSSSTHRGI